jgi:hypothetical protein
MKPGHSPDEEAPQAYYIRLAREPDNKSNLLIIKSYI